MIRCVREYNLLKYNPKYGTPPHRRARRVCVLLYGFAFIGWGVSDNVHTAHTYQSSLRFS